MIPVEYLPVLTTVEDVILQHNPLLNGGAVTDMADDILMAIRERGALVDLGTCRRCDAEAIFGTTLCPHHTPHEED